MFLFRVRRQLVSFIEFSHILKKKKKKKKLLLNYVLTCSPFGYIGSLVFYAKFSHMSKKKRKNFFEPHDGSISLRWNTRKTWYVTLSAIIVLGEYHYEIVATRRQCYRMKANIIVRHYNQKECKVTMKANIIVRMSLGISKMWFLSRL